MNLICYVDGRDHDRPPLILNTHLDTVPPGDTASWNECPDGPFVPVFKDQRVYALGAADTKLDFVAKALALLGCGRPRRDTFLVATFGEERGLVGAREIAAARILPNGAAGFVGEPSHLHVITAHKGLMVFDLEIRFSRDTEAQGSLPLYRLIFDGRSAHSSTPSLGLNAIRLAIDFLEQRPDLRVFNIDGGDAVNKVPSRCTVAVGGQPREVATSIARLERDQGSAEQFVPTDVLSLLAKFLALLADFASRAARPEPDYAPPTLTFNPGVIHSTGESIVLQFEFRPPPSLPLDEIRQGVGQIRESLSRSYQNQDFKVTERRANPGFRSSPGNETVELAMAALAAAGLPLETGVKAGCTEAGVYASVGISAVVFGPGPSTGVIHAPNEYNLVGEVEGALQFYRELLRL